jgi:hypothetical protein
MKYQGKVKTGDSEMYKSSKESNNTMLWLEDKFRGSEDFILQELNNSSFKAKIGYLKSICAEAVIERIIMKPYHEIENKDKFQNYMESLPQKQDYQDRSDILSKIMFGSVVLFTANHLYVIQVDQHHVSAPADATVENVIQGPQTALSESLLVSINMIRHRYRKASLRVELKEVGSIAHSKLAIMYDEQRVDNSILEEVRHRLEQVDLELLQAMGELQKQFSRQKRSLYPTVMITERPDRTVLNISKGKVVILLEGTPFCMVVPAVFYDFMASMEDLYQAFYIRTFLTILRYAGLLISVILPSFYVAIASYNPEIFRVQLALSIAGTRFTVPYPSFIEVLFMLLMMEMLIEASVRLPKAIGPTATTVGGLILGQAATEAGLVSNIMIIIVAAVAISNFVIPINAMSFAMRVTKYILLFFSILYGLMGMILGLVGLIAYLANLESFGKPYFKLFINEKTKKQGV